jgi:DNA-binding NarL/FixJ family response regulator
MFISEQTVKNHLHNVFEKVGVSDRLDLALYAIDRKLTGVAPREPAQSRPN